MHTAQEGHLELLHSSTNAHCTFNESIPEEVSKGTKLFFNGPTPGNEFGQQAAAAWPSFKFVDHGFLASVHAHNFVEFLQVQFLTLVWVMLLVAHTSVEFPQVQFLGMLLICPLLCPFVPLFLTWRDAHLHGSQFMNSCYRRRQLAQRSGIRFPRGAFRSEGLVGALALVGDWKWCSTYRTA